MWNVQNGSLELSCAHSSSEYVLSCDVSQDDKRLLSASVDRYAKVTNHCEGTVKLKKKNPSCISFNFVLQETFFLDCYFAIFTDSVYLSKTPQDINLILVIVKMFAVYLLYL